MNFIEKAHTLYQQAHGQCALVFPVLFMWLLESPDITLEDIKSVWQESGETQLRAYLDTYLVTYASTNSANENKLQWLIEHSDDNLAMGWYRIMDYQESDFLEKYFKKFPFDERAATYVGVNSIARANLIAYKWVHEQDWSAFSVNFYFALIIHAIHSHVADHLFFHICTKAYEHDKLYELQKILTLSDYQHPVLGYIKITEGHGDNRYLDKFIETEKLCMVQHLAKILPEKPDTKGKIKI